LDITGALSRLIYYTLSEDKIPVFSCCKSETDYI